MVLDDPATTGSTLPVALLSASIDDTNDDTNDDANEDDDDDDASNDDASNDDTNDDAISDNDAHYAQLSTEQQSQHEAQDEAQAQYQFSHEPPNESHHPNHHHHHHASATASASATANRQGQRVEYAVPWKPPSNEPVVVGTYDTVRSSGMTPITTTMTTTGTSPNHDNDETNDDDDDDDDDPTTQFHPFQAPIARSPLPRRRHSRHSRHHDSTPTYTTTTIHTYNNNNTDDINENDEHSSRGGSSSYFVSEPSVSDGDSSTHHHHHRVRVRAPPPPPPHGTSGRMTSSSSSCHSNNNNNSSSSSGVSSVSTSATAAAAATAVAANTRANSRRRVNTVAIATTTTTAASAERVGHAQVSSLGYPSLKDNEMTLASTAMAAATVSVARTYPSSQSRPIPVAPNSPIPTTTNETMIRIEAVSPVSRQQQPPPLPQSPQTATGGGGGDTTSWSSWESPAGRAKRHVWRPFVKAEPRSSPSSAVPASQKRGRRQTNEPRTGTTAAGFLGRGRSIWNRSVVASSMPLPSMLTDATADAGDDGIVATAATATAPSTLSYQRSQTNDTHSWRQSLQNHDRFARSASSALPLSFGEVPLLESSSPSPRLSQHHILQDSLLLSPTASINPRSVDESLTMTLSDSEYAGGSTIDDKSILSSDPPLDWEQRPLPQPLVITEAFDSNDDNRASYASYFKQPNASSRQSQRHSIAHLNRSGSTKSNHTGHRRNRSGDAAAAKIVTGGVGWKGMETNGIVQYPLDHHDDDESEETRVRLSSRRLQRSMRSLMPPLASTTGVVPAGAQVTPRVPMDSRQAWIRQMALLHEQTAALDWSQKPGQVSLPSTGTLRGSIHSRDANVSSGEDLETDDDDASDTDGDNSNSHGDSTSQASNRVMQNHNYAPGLGGAGENPSSSHRLSKVLSESPFANLGKKSAERAPRSSFMPSMTYETDDTKYPTFICPRCKSRQREFFTVANAASRLEGPGSYLALYFAIYVVCSLFIFGLEEGWMPLDCTYFAVITLTTAGLGDFVPTSDLNKIICSIFIYFGVACIGLLLGSYIAGMLDDRANRDRKEKQIDSCPNCARIRMSREFNARINRNAARPSFNLVHANRKHMSERFSSEISPTKSQPAVFIPRHSLHPPAPPSFSSNDPHNLSMRTAQSYDSMDGDTEHDYAIGHDLLASPTIPSPLQFLGRQSHTRHASFDISQQQSILINRSTKSYGTNESGRASYTTGRQTSSANKEPNSTTPKLTSKLRTITSGSNLMDGYSESDDESSVTSSSTESSTEEVWDSTKSRIQAGKYVFLTLRLALLNSLVIIAVGCLGFWLIEGFSLVDSWYFATVLLTTVGYGDIVPVTDGGKLFATVYILVAGTILLNNMSSISMIPLELRRRRIERTILTQFGDHLDDAALRELATGPVVQRLRLSANRTDGLDECTREMFSLAMLVRLGKVTEHDIRETFASFRHLDVNNEGVLNSKSIIAGMIAKQRINRMAASASCSNLSQLAQLSSATVVSQADTPSRPPSQESQPYLMSGRQQQQQSRYARQTSMPVTGKDAQQNAYYYHHDQFPYFGERASLLGGESAGLPDDENVSWLP